MLKKKSNIVLENENVTLKLQLKKLEKGLVVENVTSALPMPNELSGIIKGIIEEYFDGGEESTIYTDTVAKKIVMTLMDMDIY